MITAGDVKWLAGLLEGEGSFGFHKTNPRLTLNMTDRDVVERAAGYMHAAVTPFQDKRGTRKQSFTVQVYGANAVGWMMTIYSEMGQRRRARIREILTAWRAKQTGSSTSHPTAVWRRVERQKAA